MADHSDYKLPHLDLFNLLPDRHKTTFNKHLFQNTFDRFLTKTDVMHVHGLIGKTTKETLPESSPHRQAFQLQPLMHTSVATVDYINSFRDILNELTKLGVDSTKFNEWGNTDVFNFAPPVDVDKLINYVDYFWYDPAFSDPQYIVMRNSYNIALARLFQKEKEILQNPSFTITSLDDVNNIFVIEGEYSHIFQNNSQFNITGSTSNDGVWTVLFSLVSNNTTIITVTSTVNASIVLGNIDIQIQAAPFQAEVVAEAAVLANETNQWILDNKWIHRNDLSDTQRAYSVQAVFPIIEYSSNLQLNNWSRASYAWKYRETINSNWVDTDNVPTMSDIYTDILVDKTINPTFHEKWLFVGQVDIVPCDVPALNANVILATTAPPYTSLQLSAIDIDSKVYHLPAIASGNPFIPFYREMVLAGTNGIRVYVNGIRQYNNYDEETQVVGDNTYVVGVAFDDTQLGNLVEIEFGAAAASDQYLEDVPVRTSTANTNYTTNVCLMNYYKNEMLKIAGEIKYPIFDIFDINGNVVDANSIFKYQEDPAASIMPLLNMRIVLDGLKPRFEQFLITQENGVLYYYKDLSTVSLDNPNGYQSIWRTSAVPTTYTPKLVDSNRRENNEIYFENDIQYIAIVDESNGYWEIPVQWFYNASHENKKDLSYTDLVAHFISIAAAQPIPDTFFTNDTKATRLQYVIDYGIGGTIKEHNNSFDLLMSAIYATANTPLTVIEFAKNQYEVCLNTIKQLSSSLITDALLNTTNDYVFDFSNTFTNAVIAEFETNTFFDGLFGDSQTYNNSAGIKNWVQTVPFIGASGAFKPIIIKDDKLGIYQLRHHDGHLSNIHLTQTFIAAINEKIINTRLISSPPRKRGWEVNAPADFDDSFPINDFIDIPYNRLLTNDYWLNEDGTLYRFEAIISLNAPSLLSQPEGTFWMRSSDGLLFQRGPTSWDAVLSPPSLLPAWKQINLTDILADLLLEIETRLWDAVTVPVKWDETDYILSLPDDEDKKFENEEKLFLTYTKERDIPDPYASDFSPSNAFTWNYKTVDVSSFSVYYPYAKDISKWSARYDTIYENIFNTPYPHLEPWKLQGYVDKPDWWDGYYQGTLRPWSSLMWSNIKAQIVPTGELFPDGTISTGVPSPAVPSYFFVSVNTTDDTTTDGYGPDDLLPPYWVPPSVNPEDVALTNEVFIRDYPTIQTANIEEPYIFGDAGIAEFNWRHSSNFLYDTLTIGFNFQPMRFMHTLWGLDYVSKGFLNVDTLLQRVASHSRTIFHGDVIDNAVYVSPGLNQWYINLNRFLNNDTKSSDFRTLWNDWTLKYSYQVDTFIDPASLKMSNERFNIDDVDRKVILKRTQDAEEKHIDALKIKTISQGRSSTRNSTTIPKDSGHDWVFSIDNTVSKSRTISYYGVKDYRFTLLNMVSGTFQTTEMINLSTGDEVMFYASKLLPAPLRSDLTYFIIKTSDYTFKVADTYEDAITNVSIVITDIGIGVFNINRNIKEFFSYGGLHTPISWHHSQVDKDVINTDDFPFQITGIQNVLNFIDGYAKFAEDQGFVFNHTDALEIDPITETFVSWQTEQERFIDTIYTGKTTSNAYSSSNIGIEEYVVNVSLNQIVLSDPTTVYEDGDEIYFQSTNTLPQGLILNKPYYLIRVQPSLGTYKVATTEQNALNNIPIILTTDGLGTQYISIQDVHYSSLNLSVEVNPFRHNIWVKTPTGIVSDVIKGPYEEIKSLLTIYDQNGQVLNNDNVLVYRSDELTHVHVYPDIKNNQTTSNSPYDTIHISGWKVFIDYYEHVILINDRLHDGTLVYDPFLGLGIPKLLMSYDASAFYVKRPSVGGFVLSNNNQLIRNLEGRAEDLNNLYSVYDARESDDLTVHARHLLGYKDPSYLDFASLDDKSKFVFWRGVIQNKGSSSIIEAFTNSKSFVNASIEEYWAYKVATFGSRNKKVFPSFKLNVTDVYNGDAKYDFNVYSNTTLQEQNFNTINFVDFSRWKNLPDIRQSLPDTFKTIVLDVEIDSVQYVTVFSNQYVLLNKFCDSIIVVDSERVYDRDVDYSFITNNLIKFNTIVGDPTIPLLNIVSKRLQNTSFAINDQVDVSSASSPSSFIVDDQGIVTTGYPSMVFANGVLLDSEAYIMLDANTLEWQRNINAVIDIVYFENKLPTVEDSIDGVDLIANEFQGLGEYDIYKHNLLAFVNGRLVEPDVDYLEKTSTSIFLPNGLQPTDLCQAILIDGTLDRQFSTVADFVDGALPINFIFVQTQILVFANGSLLKDTVDFNIVDNTIAFVDEYHPTTQFTIISNHEQAYQSRAVQIFNTIPSKHHNSPISIVDTKSNVTVSRPFLWDPARDHHYHLPLSYVSVRSDDDPIRKITEESKFLSDIKLQQQTTLGVNKLGNIMSLSVTFNIDENSPPTYQNDNLMVFVNGSKAKAGVDYVKVSSSNTDIEWLITLQNDDEITAIVIEPGSIEHVYYTGADINPPTEASPPQYILDEYNTNHFFAVNDRLIFVNGKLMQYGVDYSDLDVTKILWINVPAETDDIEIIYTGTIFNTIVKNGSDIVSNNINVTSKIILTDAEAYQTPTILLATVNGHLVDFQVVGNEVRFNFTPAIDDEIVLMSNAVIDYLDTTQQEWDDSKVGTIWWDTSNLGYKLYHDTLYCGDTTKQLSTWGDLAEWASVDLYEWTKSSVPPAEYDLLAAVEETDATIPTEIRAAGTAMLHTQLDNQFIPEKLLSIDVYGALQESTADFKLKLSAFQKKIFTEDADVAVYVNQINPQWMKFSQFSLQDYRDQDLLHITRNIFKTEYPRIIVDVGGGKLSSDDTGLVCDTSIMYTTKLIFNEIEYFISVSGVCTYEQLINDLNAAVRVKIDNLDPSNPDDAEKPQTIIFKLNDTGNIQIDITKSNADTSLIIKDDLLFTKITDYVATSEMLPYVVTLQYNEGFSEAYDFLTIPRSRGSLIVNDYYFWVKNKSILQQGRLMSLKDMTSQLTSPTPQYFLLKKYEANDAVINPITSPTLEIPRYNHLIIRNMSDIITSNDRYKLVLTQDDTLRDYNTYYANNNKKPQYEEWSLFRENSVQKIDLTLWNKLTESVMGVNKENYNNNIITPIPTYDRVLFDSINKTSMRYGIDRDQTFGDKEVLLNTIVSTILESNTDTSPINKIEFIQLFDLTQISDIQEFMNSIYASFPIKTINHIFFECLNDLLAVQPELKDIIKTSFISVHCVDTFNTSGT